MSAFTVTIENFQGPIDALLQMIEKRKMPINDISLADIADEYISFMQNLDRASLSNTTHFIFVASTLILIKSKSLLPKLDLTDDEEEDIENLKQRIALLKQFQEAGDYLRMSFNKTPRYYFPKPQKKSIVFTPHESLEKDNLLTHLLGVFNELPEKVEKKQEAYVTIAVHIEQMMDSLIDRMKKALSTNFDSFIGEHLKNSSNQKEVRVYKVVGFLALLELVKNGALEALQKNNFETITIDHV